MELESFAAHLRALRQKAGLSQETLAARLGVSAQSVSKWENAANWPETAMILPLARLFGVSADELLTGPTTRGEWENRWQEIEGECRRRGNHAALLSLAEAALKEWPGDREFRFRQANGEYQTAAVTEDETERNRLLRAAEKHFSNLLRDHPDHEDAGVMLVQTLLARGKREEAEALAGRLPRKEKLELILRKGKTREKALRREITKAAAELLNLLQSDGSPEACAMTEAILSSAGKPPALIWYSLNLTERRARLACEGGETETALAALRELVKAARAYAPSMPSKAADAPLTGLPEPPAPAEVRRWVRDALALECFFPLRSHPGFPPLEREAQEALPP